jgi:hypothetical protein
VRPGALGVAATWAFSAKTPARVKAARRSVDPNIVTDLFIQRLGRKFNKEG